MSNTDSLYSEIMNLPAKCSVITDPDNIRWYKSGHRDARHDAAGLVAAHASAHEEKIKRLREALAAAAEELAEVVQWAQVEAAPLRPQEIASVAKCRDAARSALESTK